MHRALSSSSPSVVCTPPRPVLFDSIDYQYDHSASTTGSQFYSSICHNCGKAECCTSGCAVPAKAHGKISKPAGQDKKSGSGCSAGQKWLAMHRTTAHRNRMFQVCITPANRSPCWLVSRSFRYLELCRRVVDNAWLVFAALFALQTTAPTQPLLKISLDRLVEQTICL